MGNVVDQDAAIKARGLMPQLRSDLEALVRIPSISVPGRVDQPLLDAFEMTSRLFADAGVTVDRPTSAPCASSPPPSRASLPRSRSSCSERSTPRRPTAPCRGRR